jgi:hypothetical protein
LPAQNGRASTELLAVQQHCAGDDEGLAKAHATLALITQNYDWNWQAAVMDFAASSARACPKKSKAASSITAS